MYSLTDLQCDLLVKIIKSSPREDERAKAHNLRLNYLSDFQHGRLNLSAMQWFKLSFA